MVCGEKVRFCRQFIQRKGKPVSQSPVRMFFERDTV